MPRFLLFLISTLLIWTRSFSQETPYVILISFDGFRFDYVEKFDLPNFKAIARNGTSAEALIPSFPSKTFPNHYTIVTGLYPGHHGLVDNNFYDPDRKEIYEMRNRQIVMNPHYYGGTPLWKLAREQGIKSAWFFWVASDLPQDHRHPDFYFRYDESVADTIRIQQEIDWLKLPEKERPHFISLYFSSPDHEGHTYGPSSEENRRAVLRSDHLIGTFMEELKKINLPVNVVIVSDHGMEELAKLPDTYIFLGEIMNRNDRTVTVVNAGTHSHVYLNDKTQIDSVYEALKSKAQHYTVLKRKEFPARWHYDTPRAGDLLITAEPGFFLVDQERQKYLSSLWPGSSFGTHGYDPAATKNMRGIFYAVGPNIKSGKQIPAFENIHIYPFIAKILGLTTPKVDGSLKVLENIIKR